MMLHVDNFELRGSYKMNLWFNNGETVEVDLKNELEGEIFEPLKKPALWSGRTEQILPRNFFLS